MVSYLNNISQPPTKCVLFSFSFYEEAESDSQERDSLVERDIGSHVVGNKYGHHQAIDGNDTRHDHGNDGLHDQLRPHHWHGSNACATLGRPIRSTQC